MASVYPPEGLQAHPISTSLHTSSLSSSVLSSLNSPYWPLTPSPSLPGPSLLSDLPSCLHGSFGRWKSSNFMAPIYTPFMFWFSIAGLSDSHDYSVYHSFFHVSFDSHKTHLSHNWLFIGCGILHHLPNNIFVSLRILHLLLGSHLWSSTEFCPSFNHINCFPLCFTRIHSLSHLFDNVRLFLWLRFRSGFNFSLWLLGDLTVALGNQTSRTSNSSKTTETKRHGSKPLVSRIG